MNLPKISVVVPVLNKVDFVRKTLDSIFSQNYPNLEVLVEDGGSADGTLEIIREYQERFSGIMKLKSGPDRGQLEAINQGMARASGKILAYLNADDIYLPGALAAVAEVWTLYPETLWTAGRGRVIDIDGKEIAKGVILYKNLLLNFNRYGYLLLTNYLMQPSVFISRRAYETFGPFSGTNDFVTEYELWLKLGRRQMPYIIKKTISEFRIEPESKTKKLFRRLLGADEKIVRKYSRSWSVLFGHKLHNWARFFINRWV
jgi:glycosyltransferase involved in cell wall biosynthesis